MANQQSKNIQYSGMTTLPDDYQSVDGSLAFATNAVYEDNAVKIIPPALAKNLIVGEGCRVFIHSMASYTHYIVARETDSKVFLYFVNEDLMEDYREWARSHTNDRWPENAKTTSGTKSNNAGKSFYEVYGDAVTVQGDSYDTYNVANNIYYYTEDGERTDEENAYVTVNNKYPSIWEFCAEITGLDDAGISIQGFSGTLSDIKFVGNTMVMVTSGGTYYFLWSVTDGYYKYLGSSIPQLLIQWGLSLDIAYESYANTGIKISTNNDVLEADAQYKPLNVYYLYNQTGNELLCINTRPPEYIMKEGYTYRFRRECFGKHDSKVHVHGDDSNHTGVNTRWTGEDLFNIDDNNWHYFTAQKNYVYLHFEIRKRKSGVYVYMEEADTEGQRPTCSGKAVEHSSENHTAIMGYMNKFIEEKGKKQDRFMHPFFVRYATRLWDGTHTGISSPILMYPNTGYAPFFKVSGSSSNCTATLIAFVASLEYQIKKTIRSEWEDLIMGVDVYVSTPLYPYDQGHAYSEYETFVEYKYFGGPLEDDNGNVLDAARDYALNGRNYGIGSPAGDAIVVSPGETEAETEHNNTARRGTGVNEEDDTSEYYPLDLLIPATNNYKFGYVSANNEAVTCVEIAAKTEEEKSDDIANVCNYYKIAEIEFDELLSNSSDLVSLTLEEGVLNALEARETLKEETVATDNFFNCGMHIYNNRLHMYGGSRNLPPLESIVRQNQYCQTGYWDKNYVASAVRIKTDDGIKTVVSTDETRVGLPWFFYPDTRAYEYIEYVPSAFWGPVQKFDGNGSPDVNGDGNYPVYYPTSERAYKVAVYKLTTHDFLNGAYLLRDVNDFCASCYTSYEPLPLGKEEEDETTWTMNQKILNLNKIYVSEASNPFVFKNAMVCTAGSGQVLALSSAAKALSQGQFGQFPLYAFTDEGIWAMSVGSTGAYETVQPIARDVVTNVAAITQLDSAVVFVTNRGVMLVEGGNVVCMSDDIDGDFGQFDPRTLSDFYDIMKKHLGFSTDDTDNTIGKWASQAFFDFIRGCRMKYDYVHQRITMYSADCDIAYVYSLKSKQWLMQLTALQDNVDSYPDAYALRNTDAVGGVASAELVNLSEYDLETERLPMVFVTRPFKLDAPDTFKTVNDIMQRGYFRQDEKTNHIIGVSLYGSPDLFNWFLIKNNVGHKIQNLHGSPYKYFRVLVVSQLDAREGISGCSVWFEPKDTQRMR